MELKNLFKTLNLRYYSIHCPIDVHNSIKELVALVNLYLVSI